MSLPGIQGQGAYGLLDTTKPVSSQTKAYIKYINICIFFWARRRILTKVKWWPLQVYYRQPTQLWAVETQVLGQPPDLGQLLHALVPCIKLEVPLSSDSYWQHERMISLSFPTKHLSVSDWRSLINSLTLGSLAHRGLSPCPRPGSRLFRFFLRVMGVVDQVPDEPQASSVLSFFFHRLNLILAADICMLRKPLAHSTPELQTLHCTWEGGPRMQKWSFL